jgi:hypothetical protein
VLSYRPLRSQPIHQARICRIHSGVHPRLLNHSFILTIWMRTGEVPAIPETVDIVARYDLGQAAGLDVSDFNEAGVEEEDVGSVKGDFDGCAFPLDGYKRAAGFSVFVDEETEFCRDSQQAWFTER